jgi:glycosyltransferase involved in cell wall biosynthesis
MRIAFVNHSRRKVGGAEVYLDSVIPAFADAGHQIACLYEFDLPADRECINLPSSAPSWNVSSVGREQAVAQLRSWRPDICFTHGLHDPELESRIMGIAPSALFLHNYYGTCISGDKTWSTGTPQPCERRFGPECLLHYFPHGCGGRNPLTMWSRYQLQSRRLELMRHYTVLIANSEHMRREMARHELASEALHCPITSWRADSPATPAFEETLQLIFAGRMTALKGGQFLLGALAEVSERLGRALHVLFAGDGPERGKWEKTASAIRSAQISIEFTGWLEKSALHERMKCAHLLVYPSVWPEPFGLSGLEAGCYGVPTVAFEVGGIPEWLLNGANGHLADMPANSGSLAKAILRCLVDKKHYCELRTGAFAEAGKYKVSDHVARLTKIFRRCTA